jgi:hypothetical protein
MKMAVIRDIEDVSEEAAASLIMVFNIHRPNDGSSRIL